MRRTCPIGFAALAGLFISAPAQAAVSTPTPVGQYYATFLEAAQGARPAAMGDAYIAVADDINAAFWNAAGLVDLPRKKLQFSFTNTRWLSNSQFNSGALGINTDHGAFAFSFVMFHPPKVSNTTRLKPQEGDRFLDTGSWAIGGAYARRLTERFSAGGHLRAIEEKMQVGRQTGVPQDYRFRTLDLAVGMKYSTGFRGLRVAASMRNFGKDQVFLLDECDILTGTLVFTPSGRDRVLLLDDGLRGRMPTAFNVAAAAEVIGKRGGLYSFTGVVEGLYSVGVERQVHIGGELWLRNLVALRGGYKRNYGVQDFTAGAGVRLNRGDRYLSADFAWVNFGKQFDAPLRFSVTGSF